MGLLKLFTTEVQDKFVRENFQRLERYFRADPLAKSQLTFFELELASDTTAGYPVSVTYPHRLGFRPTDVIQLSISPDDATVIWEYGSFTRENLSIYIAEAVTVRALIGRYGER